MCSGTRKRLSPTVGPLTRRPLTERYPISSPQARINALHRKSARYTAPRSIPLHEEIHMHTKTYLVRTCPVLGAALVCMLFSGALAAQDRMVTVAVVTVAARVNAKGLDLTRMKDAHTFYTRLEKAAWVVCTGGDRVDLVPVDDSTGCYEKALASAIRSAKAPLITQLYLSTHTFAEAVAQGIYSPTQMAGR